MKIVDKPHLKMKNGYWVASDGWSELCYQAIGKDIYECWGNWYIMRSNYGFAI